MIRMPARQCRPVLDNVSDRPEHAALVATSRDVVSGTEAVEVAGFQTLDHEIDRLLGGPGSGRLFGAAPRGETGEDVTGDQEMRGDTAAIGVAQLVLQRFGESLHAGLADVIGG